MALIANPFVHACTESPLIPPFVYLTCPCHHSKCGYLDNKEQLEGGVDDGWAFFVLPAVSEGGVVGFCADFPKDKRLSDFAFLVLLNGEEVQDSMEFWHDAKTLGVSIQCYGTTKRVQSGDDNLGFRYVWGTVVVTRAPPRSTPRHPTPPHSIPLHSTRSTPTPPHATPPHATTRVMQKGQTLKLTHVIWR